MVDLSGPRAPSWHFELLDREDRPLGTLDGVTGGRIETSAFTKLGGSGELQIDETGAGIDWSSHRFRATYDPGIESVAPWDVATMLFTSPKTFHSDLGATHRVTVLPKTAVLDEDATDGVISFPEGTPIIPAVIQLIESAGEMRIAATDTGVTLGAPQVFEAGTSKLAVINKLLEAAGYWSIRCDGMGQFLLFPYTEPAARPVAYEFAAGEASIVMPDWEREQDMSSVPNKCVVVGEGSDELPPLVGVATNEDPTSPFSYQARGRWITRTETGVEAADQAVIDEIARRRLLSAMSPVAKIDATHAVLPLSPHQRIKFSPEGTVPRTATITRLKYTIDEFTDCAAEWREV